MIWFYLALALHALVVAADVVTTNMFLARGGKEGFALSRWFMETFGKFWPAPKALVSLILAVVCYFVALTYPVGGAILLTLPTLFVGAVGVFRNYQWLRDHG